MKKPNTVVWFLSILVTVLFILLVTVTTLLYQAYLRLEEEQRKWKEHPAPEVREVPPLTLQQKLIQTPVTPEAPEWAVSALELERSEYAGTFSFTKTVRLQKVTGSNPAYGKLKMRAMTLYEGVGGYSKAISQQTTVDKEGRFTVSPVNAPHSVTEGVKILVRYERDVPVINLADMLEVEYLDASDKVHIAKFVPALGEVFVINVPEDEHHVLDPDRLVSINAMHIITPADHELTLVSLFAQSAMPNRKYVLWYDSDGDMNVDREIATATATAGKNESYYGELTVELKTPVTIRPKALLELRHTAKASERSPLLVLKKFIYKQGDDTLRTINNPPITNEGLVYYLP